MDETARRLNLAGRTAFVSGASGHIGRTIARTLASAGARLVLHGHLRGKAVQGLAEELNRGGQNALALSGDLTRERAAAELMNTAAGAGFAPDILVNNAARQDVTALAQMSEQDWRAMFAVTLDAAFALTQAFCALNMAAKKPGVLVNIASIEGMAPAAGHAHYASAKAALLHFTRAAALEYGPSGIRINAVSPGLIERPGLAEDWPEGVQRWRASAPLRCVGQAQDVADAVLFLVSPMSRWISGTNLVVDGGMNSGGKW